jgi:hypothetical protein
MPDQDRAGGQQNDRRERGAAPSAAPGFTVHGTILK